jgi:hypothetical protein
MGFFSFKTTDKGRSICNVHSGKKTFKVIVVDNQNNQYIEDSYTGHGRFGGIDIFVLIAHMNGHFENENKCPDKEYERIRTIGIDLYYDDENAIHPNIYQVAKPWEDKKLEACDAQGYWY